MSAEASTEGLVYRPGPKLPQLQSSIDCPCTPFSIGAEACASRQIAFTKAMADEKLCKICTHECSNFNLEAHGMRLKDIRATKKAPPPPAEREEGNPMDQTFDRELPPGAKVTRTGRVWCGGQEKKPCPKCKDGWMTSQSSACLNCAPKKGRYSGEAGKERAALMRQKKAAKHSPEPKVADIRHLADRVLAPVPPEEKAKFPSLAADSELAKGIVEDLAQLLADKVRTRAAEILGLQEVAS